jgi:cell shape-determining protein MreD
VRLRWLALTSLAVLMLQLGWPSGAAPSFVVPNFFLIYMVLLSVYVDAVRLMWVALVGGLALDLMAGPEQFGVNMAFYILTVLVLKVVLQFDVRNAQAATLVASTIALTFLYGAVSHLSLVGIGYIAQWWPMLSRILVEALWNGAMIAVGISVIQLRQRGIISS